MTFEFMPVFWILAFITDIGLGVLLFGLLYANLVRPGFESVVWYLAWWSFVDATAIVMNGVMGTDSFWSYHQTGIVIETAINAGLLWLAIKCALINWKNK